MRYSIYLLLIALLVALVLPVHGAINLVTYSQEFNYTGAWTITGASIPASLVDSQVAPDGTTTAESFNESSSGAKYIYQPTTITTVLNQNYTVSVHVKPNPYAVDRVIQLTVPAAGFPPTYANYVLIGSGTISADNGGISTIAYNSTTGWYRISLSVKSDAAGGSVSPQIALCNNNTAATRTPSYSGGSAHDFFIWGAQSETGDSMSAYNATNVPAAAGAPVMADFTVDRTTAGYNAPLVFTDASSGDSLSYNWSFGDGNLSTDKNPIHIFSPPGTYSINLTVTNTSTSNHTIKSNYITIDSRPDSYLTPYVKMVPWMDQGNTPECSGHGTATALTLLRYATLGTAPSATQEPFVRNGTVVTIGGDPVSSDTHVDYAPSPASIYFDYKARSATANTTALAEVMRLDGYNLQIDKITSKYNATEYFYPQTSGYDAAHKYNKIADYELVHDNSAGAWDLLIENISDHQGVIVNMDVYSNYDDNSMHVTMDNGMIATMFKNPTGSEVDGHVMAVAGYNRSRNEVYTFQSWGDSRWGKDWTKLSGFTKAYWIYGDSSSRSTFIVPHNMTVDEILEDIIPPVGISNLQNSTPTCDTITWTWDNPGEDQYNTTIYRNNSFVQVVDNVTVTRTWTGLPASTAMTFSSFTCDLSNNCNSTWVNKTANTISCGTPTPTPTPTTPTPTASPSPTTTTIDPTSTIGMSHGEQWSHDANLLPVSVFSNGVTLISLLISVIIIVISFYILTRGQQSTTEMMLDLAIAVSLGLVIFIVCYYVGTITGGTIAAI